ncbi:MAG TPA: hypothetical protein VG435_16245 [Acidimicrobiales bacterium]|jgi:uncharacterized membrane protein YeaQ/YmgE (transglycosylase-associated protein family)|nr:hypothetical protein [Acidimicrobiales bacterium]
MLALILLMIIAGAIVGALGRLVVPGPNPIGFIRTVLVGWAGSFLGGLVGRLVFGWRYEYSGLLALVVAVLFTALIVYLIDGRYRRRPARW